MASGASPALALAAALAILAGGCASSEPAASAPASGTAEAAAPSTSQSLYDLPQMKQARLHRERGARHLESAYAARDRILRENDFEQALREFRSAEEAYHSAIPAAPARFRPMIDNEIEQVAQYMRQIQRDRRPAEEESGGERRPPGR